MTGQNMQMEPGLDLIYDDRDIIVVNKPGGLLAVPGKGREKQDSVTHRLRNCFPEMIKQPAVHRLDMYTSGLMIAAKNRSAHRYLSIQFEQRKVQKKYVAVVESRVQQDSGIIALSFRLDPNNRPLQIYDPLHGKRGVTLWRKICNESSGSRIEFVPITGRTHQLRLHAAHKKGLNAPVVGDSLYGTGKDGDQMLLCAFSIGFYHPANDTWTSFEIPPPF